MGKKSKSAPRKEKVAKVKKKTQKGVYYTFESGKVKRERKTCPRCGKGYFMAQHYDRRTCGNCSYTQFLDKNGKVRGGSKTRQRRTRRRVPRSSSRRSSS